MQVWGETKIKSIDNEFRQKAIGTLINLILDRHSKKMAAKYFYRMFEHSSLVHLSYTYKRDMEANHDDFVYVTYQEQQRR
jgi:hypothetical protein